MNNYIPKFSHPWLNFNGGLYIKINELMESLELDKLLLTYFDYIQIRFVFPGCRFMIYLFFSSFNGPEK